ncbi:nitroreductase family deazaflavin-dependent oxidoreductase [Streptomyces sp. PR69]|uniref:nitroreductase family deazaflavin-dependent oxidoreductase n=1 Tax=Streptomyces sp. PR69 TaxID=2984950 RepID=UPI002264C770|nr:nitroreductase family deazaflavin-dependent oxidoreductase [Streptomyces sp. PR69]
MTSDPLEGHWPKRLTGWRRVAARLPNQLFRIGLGPLFRGRLLRLVHTGRSTGLARETVVEVVEHTPGSASWVVASGFGPKADWYRNLRAHPQATIQSGRRYRLVTAHFVEPEEGGRIMARYAAAHPRTAQRLCRYMGLPVDRADRAGGAAESYRAAGERIPFVRLQEDDVPRRGPAPDG